MSRGTSRWMKCIFKIDIFHAFRGCSVEQGGCIILFIFSSSTSNEILRSWNNRRKARTSIPRLSKMLTQVEAIFQFIISSFSDRDSEVEFENMINFILLGIRGGPRLGMRGVICACRNSDTSPFREPSSWRGCVICRRMVSLIHSRLHFVVGIRHSWGRECLHLVGQC